MRGVRTFVGIPLEAAVSSALLEACARVREADASWRGEKWVLASNLHVTLRFIGTVAEDRLDALGDALGDAIHASMAEGARTAHDAGTGIELPLAGLRAVPSPRRARMLWAAFLDPTGGCAALAGAVERATLPFGGEMTERAFSPHVTLVRARSPHAVAGDALEAAVEALGTAPPTMSVTRATLYSSTLEPTGPVYTNLRSYPLGRD